MVEVEFNNQKKKNLELFVVDGKFPTMMRRSWIHAFLGKNWLDKVLQTERSKVVDQFKTPVMKSKDEAFRMNYAKDEESERKIKDYVQKLRQNKIFQPGLGLVQNYEAKLTLKESAKPVRSLPYALREKVSAEIKSMEEQGILEKTESSKWGTPIVAVQRGSKIRICGDYKSTLNKVLETKMYPLPTTEECFNAMTGGKKFSVIDIKSANNNPLIREEDRKLTVINTHLGLFQ